MNAPRPRFVVVNLVVLALGFAAWHLGLFDQFPDLGRPEVVMCMALIFYGMAGAIAGFCGNWRMCSHIGNSLPIVALGFTGLGLILAVSGLKTLDPAAMAGVFRALAFAICPNICGVMLMWWLRELAYWAAGEEL